MKSVTSIHQFEKLLLDSHLVLQNDLLGCAEQEIQEIEEAFGERLPKFYVDFLRKMGRDAGRFLKGTSAFYPELLKLRGYAEELLDEVAASFRLGEKDFVFYVHQGYQFAYFPLDAGDDPPVWCFDESWSEPVKKAEALSDFFCGIVQDMM